MHYLEKKLQGEYRVIRNPRQLIWWFHVDHEKRTYFAAFLGKYKIKLKCTSSDPDPLFKIWSNPDQVWTPRLKIPLKSYYSCSINWPELQYCNLMSKQTTKRLILICQNKVGSWSGLFLRFGSGSGFFRRSDPGFFCRSYPGPSGSATLL